MSTWMVVEDEPSLYDTLMALFNMWSIDGVAFTNGTDAIKWIDDVDQGSAETNRPELAILDIRLPGASGPQIGARLRKSPVLKDITIVLITAYHLTPTDEKRAIAEAQADALIYKPLPAPAAFHDMLQKAINARHKVAAPPAEKPAEKVAEKPTEEAAARPAAQPAPQVAAEKEKSESPAPPPDKEASPGQALAESQ